MTLMSMTGFAREAGFTGSSQWAWELKTVNGRGLEVRLRSPAGLDGVAEEARRCLTAALSRGQCHLTLTLSRVQGPSRIVLNRPALESLVSALSDLPVPAGMRPASLDGLLAVRGIVEVEEEAAPASDPALVRDLTEAAGRLTASIVAARAGEGAALARILDDQLAGIARLVEAADKCPARQPDVIRQKLAAQVEILVGSAGSLDPVRLHQEAALLATRADVREEIDRLRAHLASAGELLAVGGAVGRRLDFLAQEFGREANTLCSKANDVALSRIGLELKALVEQFREQVQNVE